VFLIIHRPQEQLGMKCDYLFIFKKKLKGQIGVSFTSVSYLNPLKYFCEGDASGRGFDVGPG
jgi:hypothetical protein